MVFYILFFFKCVETELVKCECEHSFFLLFRLSDVVKKGLTVKGSPNPAINTDKEESSGAPVASGAGPQTTTKEESAGSPEDGKNAPMTTSTTTMTAAAVVSAKDSDTGSSKSKDMMESVSSSQASSAQPSKKEFREIGVGSADDTHNIRSSLPK